MTTSSAVPADASTQRTRSRSLKRLRANDAALCRTTRLHTSTTMSWSSASPPGSHRAYEADDKDTLVDQHSATGRQHGIQRQRRTSASTKTRPGSSYSRARAREARPSSSFACLDRAALSRWFTARPVMPPMTRGSLRTAETDRGSYGVFRRQPPTAHTRHNPRAHACASAKRRSSMHARPGANIRSDPSERSRCPARR